MQPKKTPMRKCVGCGEMKPKKELRRIVRSPEGEISVDLTGKKSGRGLARRAGKLIIGRDGVVASVRAGRAKLVLLTADASPRHRQELGAIGCGAFIRVMPCTMEDIAFHVGKKSCILALEDENFSSAIEKLI
mgnify:CR=1 FL=1